MILVRAMTVFMLLVASASALGVDSTGIKLHERWSVVGVISGDSNAANDTGIAVLRNNASKRTYTLAIGDAVPSEFGFVLKSVKNRQVVIGDTAQSVQLAFAEASAEETETVSQTARFIDNYYRSLGDAPKDTLSEDDGPSFRQDGESGYVPLSRFSGGVEARKSRFELYRAEQGYRSATDDGLAVDEPEEVVVNYDNFAEDEPTDYERPSTSHPTLVPSEVEEIMDDESNQ